MILLTYVQKRMEYLYSENHTLNPIFYILLNDIAMDKAMDALDT